MVHAAVRARRRRTSATPYRRPYPRVPSCAVFRRIAGRSRPGNRINCWTGACAAIETGRPRPMSSWHFPCFGDDDAVTCGAWSPPPPYPQTVWVVGEMNYLGRKVFSRDASRTFLLKIYHLIDYLKYPNINVLKEI